MTGEELEPKETMEAPERWSSYLDYNAANYTAINYEINWYRNFPDNKAIILLIKY